MFIELDTVLGTDGVDIGVDYSFPMEEPEFTSPVCVSGKVYSRTGIVKLSVIAEFDYRTNCARCDREFTRHFTVPVEHFLVDKLNDEDMDEYIAVEDMHLDLDALVSEDIFLSFPMVFLCKPDCKGLCPQCGADLNEGNCSCRRPVDPRFESLLGLLGSDDD